MVQIARAVPAGPPTHSRL